VSEPPSSEDLDPYPATTRPTPPNNTYTLKCEEPDYTIAIAILAK